MKNLLLLLLCFTFPFMAMAEEANPESLYQYQTTLIDQNGSPVPFSVFKGSPVVITMFYSSCTYSCPVLIAALKKMEASLPEKTLANTRFLLISFDPENDNAQNLKKAALENKVDLNRWKLTVPKEVNAVRELANLLGVQYRKSPDGVINHNTMITLLDQNGSPMLQEEGLVESLAHVKDKLK